MKSLLVGYYQILKTMFKGQKGSISWEKRGNFVDLLVKLDILLLF